MKDMDSVLKVLETVHGSDPTVHYAREATVAAIGPFHAENYHALPILQSQTCKSERGPEFATLLDNILAQWKIHGEPTNGPIFSVSYDGDSVFRQGGFKILMSDDLKDKGALYDKLKGLMGLNLRCSKDGIVSAPDPKHCTKREFLLSSYLFF
jgi:hypothetical protein